MIQEERVKRHVLDVRQASLGMVEAIEAQRASEDVRSLPQVHDLTIRIERVMRGVITELDGLLAADDGSREPAGVKNAVRGAMAVIGGLFDRLRDYPVSEMLRRDYTALSDAVISAGVLHAVAISHGEEGLAHAALDHGRRVSELLEEIRGLMPAVVTRELEADGTARRDALSDDELGEASRHWRALQAEPKV